MTKKTTETQNISENEGKGLKQKYLSMISWFKAKKIRWIGSLILLAVVLFLVVNTFISRANAGSEYQTAPVQRGDLIAIVGATGIVEARQTVDLSWQTSGRVENIFFNTNEKVNKGEILAELADNTLPQSVILAQADLVNSKKELDDLINSTTESSQKYQDLLQVEKELRTATDNRNRWNYSSASWDRIYTARSNFIRLEEELKRIEVEFSAVRDLAVDNPEREAVKKAFDDAKLARDKALRELNYILGRPYNREVADDFAAYDVALSKLEDAQREWERVKDGPNADDISAAEARVAAAEATVSLGWIEAPFNGTITMAKPKVGDNVINGAPGFRIDDLSKLYVKVDISEVDINRVQVGQDVDLTFDAVAGRTFQGEVTQVSSVGVDNGRGVDFEVTVIIIDPDDQVRPGMTAAVNIVVSEIKDVLIIPSRAIRLNNGQRVVYLLRDGRLKEVQISTGASSDTEAQVTQGDLAEGELVVLNPPSFFQSNGGPPPFVRQ
jgi:HlyD family secretion protein